jgi:hypothetical protein
MSTEIKPTDELLQSSQVGAESYLKHVQQRRSIRKLTNGPISDKTIHTILEAGRWSPSSANTQPARLVVVKERHQELWDFIEQSLKAKLQGPQLERALNRLPGYRGGVFTIIFYEDTAIANNTPTGMDAKIWKNFAAQAMGIIQTNVWNAIAAAGLAASNQHINFQIEEELRSFLDVPSTWESYSIFPVGYPAETAPENVRHPHEKVIFYERGPAE